MATHISMNLDARGSLLRPMALGGTFIFVIQLIHMWVVYTLIQQTPLMVSLQYIASGAIGNAAFAGGIATALFGVLCHLVISFVIAAVFILSADRIPLLRRNALTGGLMYGFGVFFVLNLIVTPLSATPPIPAPTLPWLIEAIVEHMVFVGLPLGILARRGATPVGRGAVA